MKPHPTIVVSLLLLGLGCGDSTIGGPDGRSFEDTGKLPDANLGGATLVFEFASEPEIPGESDGDGDPIIEQFEITMQDFRALGDSSDGQRTSVDNLVLEWPNPPVDKVTFSQAPLGRYSTVLAEVTAYSIEGTVEVDSQRVRFRIAEAGIRTSVAASIQVLLEPDDARRIGMTIEIEEVVKEVEWEEATFDQGILVIDSSSPGIKDVREELEDVLEAAEGRT